VAGKNRDFGGGLSPPPRQNFPDHHAHAPVRHPFGLRDLGDRHAGVEEIYDPPLAGALRGVRFAAPCEGSIAAGRIRRGVARRVSRHWFCPQEARTSNLTHFLIKRNKNH
jgi:hypothetical protein